MEKEMRRGLVHEYFLESSIHGLKYLAEKGRPFGEM
jgi:hypothetical protein